MINIYFSDLDPNNPNKIAPGNYVVVDSDSREVSPLIPKNTPITLNYVSNCLNSVILHLYPVACCLYQSLNSFMNSIII
jgi:hypothetical protein